MKEYCMVLWEWLKGDLVHLRGQEGFPEGVMFKADSKDEQELAVLGQWGWKEPFVQKEQHFQELQGGKTLHFKELK